MNDNNNHIKFNKIFKIINTYFPDNISIRINKDIVEIEYFTDDIRRKKSYDTNYFLNHCNSCPKCGEHLIAPYFCVECGGVQGYDGADYIS